MVGASSGCGRRRWRRRRVGCCCALRSGRSWRRSCRRSLGRVGSPFEVLPAVAGEGCASTNLRLARAAAARLLGDDGRCPAIDVAVAGRSQRGVVDGVPYVLDVAHNPTAWRAFLGELPDEPHVVVAAVTLPRPAASFAEVLAEFRSRSATVVATTTRVRPTEPPAELARLLGAAGIEAHAVEPRQWRSKRHWRSPRDRPPTGRLRLELPGGRLHGLGARPLTNVSGLYDRFRWSTAGRPRQQADLASEVLGGRQVDRLLERHPERRGRRAGRLGGVGAAPRACLQRQQLDVLQRQCVRPAPSRVSVVTSTSTRAPGPARPPSASAPATFSSIARSPRPRPLPALRVVVGARGERARRQVAARLERARAAQALAPAPGRPARPAARSAPAPARP